MKKILTATLATLMLCALAACGGGKDDKPGTSNGGTQTSSPSNGGTQTSSPSNGGTQTSSPSNSGTQNSSPNETITVAFDFSGAESTAVQHSSYNVLDGVEITTSTGVSLKTRATVTSDCGLNGKLLDTTQIRTCKIDYSVDLKISNIPVKDSASRTVEIVEATVQEGNLVSNPSFELGAVDWELATHEGGTGEFTVVKDSELNQNVAKVVMTGLNWTNASSPRLNSATYATNASGEDKRFTMTGGQNYQVSFKAKALTTKYVEVSIGSLMPAAPWYEAFTSEEQIYTAEVGTEWKEYSYTFTATHATLEECSILFSMGRVAPTADVITTLWFADVYVGVFEGNVTDDAAPTIKGANNITISSSSTPFDLLAGITVTDNVDTDLVAEAYVNGQKVSTLDVSAAGTHTIVYKATDNSGNEGTATRVITVVASGTNLLADVDADRVKEDSWCESWITQSVTTDTDGSIKVHTVGIGDQSYVNQINLNNLPIVGGQSYTLTFEIKTSYDLKVAFIQNQNPYTSYAEATIAANSEFTLVTLTINAPEVDPLNKLTIELGTVGSDITFNLRNFTLVQN